MGALLAKEVPAQEPQLQMRHPTERSSRKTFRNPPALKIDGSNTHAYVDTSNSLVLNQENNNIET
jgi:hypothetical protein